MLIHNPTVQKLQAEQRIRFFALVTLISLVPARDLLPAPKRLLDNSQPLMLILLYSLKLSGLLH